MNRWLRQHRYAASTAFGRLIHQPFSSLANILVIALTLAAPLIGWALLVSAQPLVKDLPVNPEITLYLKLDTSLEQAQKLTGDLRQKYADDVLSSTLISRDQAYNELKKNPLWADALSTLGENPLPHSVVLSLKDAPDQTGVAERLASELATTERIERVQLDSDWLKRLDSLLQFVRVALSLLSLCVAVIMIATVFNTVRLQALNQREEIAVARLVGATESFVRRPFLYQGAITGVASSLVAVLLAWLALPLLSDALNRLAASYQQHVQLHLPDSVNLLEATVLIALIAALAARWSVTRSTQF
ncbi:cell division protein FtsX [Paenalcaligenes sp. Me131]|uniref:cell division protein FtsX n=1 Tax=Paenalcaligenes sp. Me131 TaxID=3392636 RepID=UPI003D274AF2